MSPTTVAAAHRRACARGGRALALGTPLPHRIGRRCCRWSVRRWRASPEVALRANADAVRESGPQRIRPGPPTQRWSVPPEAVIPRPRPPCGCGGEGVPHRTTPSQSAAPTPRDAL